MNEIKLQQQQQQQPYTSIHIKLSALYTSFLPNHYILRYNGDATLTNKRFLIHSIASLSLSFAQQFYENQVLRHIH